MSAQAVGLPDGSDRLSERENCRSIKLFANQHKNLYPTFSDRVLKPISWPNFMQARVVAKSINTQGVIEVPRLR